MRSPIPVSAPAERLAASGIASAATAITIPADAPRGRGRITSTLWWSVALIALLCAIALLAPDLACVEGLTELNDAARALASRHWPGPLTLVVRAKPGLPAALVRDGTVGVRVPGASLALDLVRAFGGALTATSCNPSGHPAAQTAEEVRGYFGARLQILGEVTPGGAPSTLVDATGATVRILRQGAVSLP